MGWGDDDGDAASAGRARWAPGDRVSERAMTAGPRVLVVDDERFFREAVRDALRGLSVRCELAESGEEALKLAEDPGIEAVVLDVRMPGMGGIEVLRALREQRPMLRVIVLSANRTTCSLSPRPCASWDARSSRHRTSRRDPRLPYAVPSG